MVESLRDVGRQLQRLVERRLLQRVEIDLPAGGQVGVCWDLHHGPAAGGEVIVDAPAVDVGRAAVAADGDHGVAH